MQQDSQFTSAGTPSEGEAGKSGRTIVEPRFDEETVRRARPATPLSRLTGNNNGPRVVIAACLAAGIVAGVLGGLAAVKYYNRSAVAASRPESVATANSNETAAAQPAPSETPLTPTDVETPAAPLNAENNNASPTNERDARRGEERLTGEDKPDPARDNREAVSAPAAAGQKGATHDALRSALGEWVAATNARDIRKQMAFYGGKVDAFYRERNASRDIVRQEKERAFGKAERVAIRAGAPDIKLSPDGRTATMLFRKEYEIKRGSRERKGAVLQELRWRRSSDGGWKIVYERDVRVLN